MDMICPSAYFKVKGKVIKTINFFLVYGLKQLIGLTILLEIPLVAASILR